MEDEQWADAGNLTGDRKCPPLNQLFSIEPCPRLDNALSWGQPSPSPFFPPLELISPPGLTGTVDGGGARFARRDSTERINDGLVIIVKVDVSDPAGFGKFVRSIGNAGFLIGMDFVATIA